MLNELSVFIEVVQAGSISAAARNLNTSIAKISRQLSVLENYFETPLLQRTSRGIVLLPEGEVIFERALNPISELKQLKSRSKLDSSRFKLIAPNNLLYSRLFESIVTLVETPQFNLDIKANNANVRLSQESFDLALRVGEQKDSSYYQKKLGSILVQPVYKVGEKKNRLIIPFRSHQSGAIDEQLTSQFEELCYIDDISVVRRLVESGAGVGMLPMTEIQQLCITHEFAYFEHSSPLFERPLYALWHGNSIPSGKCKLVINTILATIGQLPEFQGRSIPLPTSLQ